MGAPIVLAKGQDLVARTIKTIAQWNGVPMVENPPLARALYRSVDIGSVIPANFTRGRGDSGVRLSRTGATTQRNGARA